MQNKINKASIDNLINVVGKAVHSGNNHLSTIMTSCDLIIGQYTGEARHKANVIKTRCKAMAEQLKALRQFASLGESDMYISNSIGLVCEKMFHEHLSTLEPNSTIQLKNLIPEDLKLHSPLHMTEILFGEVLKNAIQSLITAEVKNKTITVSAKQLPDRLVILIADNGPAIDNDIKEYMFEPFYSSRINEPGMGLSIAKQALLLMNGHIFYERNDNFNIFKLEFNNITENL